MFHKIINDIAQNLVAGVGVIKVSIECNEGVPFFVKSEARRSCRKKDLFYTHSKKPAKFKDGHEICETQAGRSRG